jgi:D-glycero-beta-D-manno-heptose-7-phosphate kinase
VSISTTTPEQVFQAFESLRILIVGDVMLDSYIWGSVDRISPEAPVPIVRVKKKDVRLGGAANVALNVKALGATPIVCALIGRDDDGKRLLQCLHTKGISAEGVVISEYRPTTVKTRIIASDQHVVRVDEENDSIATLLEERMLLEKIEELLPTCNAVVFEDYDKGVLNEQIIQRTVDRANQLGIPVVVDPKKRNFLAYKNVTLFKPNLKELREGLKVEIESSNQEQVETAVAALKEKLSARGVMVTLSEHGVYIDFDDKKVKLPAHLREIADVSGAGDTVVSIAVLCVALNLPGYLTAAMSNLGGGLVCQHVGVVPIDKAELLHEAVINNIFRH